VWRRGRLCWQVIPPRSLPCAEPRPRQLDQARRGNSGLLRKNKMEYSYVPGWLTRSQRLEVWPKCANRNDSLTITMVSNPTRSLLPHRSCCLTPYLLCRKFSLYDRTGVALSRNPINEVGVLGDRTISTVSRSGDTDLSSTSGEPRTRSPLRLGPEASRNRSEALSAQAPPQAR
jgi:hypothetical protein